MSLRYQNVEGTSTYNWKLGVFVFLLAGCVTAQFFHSTLHIHHHAHENHDVHYDGCQESPCHVTIHHGNSQLGCNHKGHWTQDEEDCSDCQWVIQTYSQKEEVAVKENVVQVPGKGFEVIAFIILKEKQTNFLRGPPVLS